MKRAKKMTSLYCFWISTITQRFKELRNSKYPEIYLNLSETFFPYLTTWKSNSTSLLTDPGCLSIWLCLIWCLVRDDNYGTNVSQIGEPNCTEFDLKNPRICPIWFQSDLLWSQTYHPCRIPNSAEPKWIKLGISYLLKAIIPLVVGKTTFSTYSLPCFQSPDSAHGPN